MPQCARALLRMKAQTFRLTLVEDSITAETFLWESFKISHPSETRLYDPMESTPVPEDNGDVRTLSAPLLLLCMLCGVSFPCDMPLSEAMPISASVRW